MNRTAQKILNLVKTKNDLFLLNSEIEALIPSLYKKNIKKAVKECVRVEIFELVLEAFEDAKWNTEEIKEILVKIRDELDKFKTLKLAIGFEPPSKFINNLHKWITLNIGKHIVIELVVDRSIIGGAIVTYEGLYKDYTVKKDLNRKIEKGEIEFKKFLI